MTAVRLTTRTIEKVWGRHRLGLGFDDVPAGAEPVGEIWFEAPDGAAPELLVKYLFTSARLSVQVHPDDDQARARGHARGKEECWLILDAEPEATIGIGLTETIDSTALRAAALDGSIERLLDWKPVAPGDFFYLTAGTIHAIGAGVTLLEVQQNIDLTYRLYDYGRPRTLHLDDAADVAVRTPWHAPDAPGEVAPGRTILAAGRKFVLEQWSGDHAGRLGHADSGPCWLIPLEGSGTIDGQDAAPGGVWYASDAATIAYSGALLVAYPGGKVAPALLKAA
ncbi:class I mannose-6-phosphate isomerase [Parasphingopyxis lamellibrachiae]|uniref:Mannose-6-phosphate isomerase type 1 n=1 Tax=Parasphingopyxis lamellibrachiae TaxID=680125 RepID=A0A3D9FGD0_9SPHN|nr:class I mannose-6-phosphate isomerase [Parasphingopyxis lamellibrachiae]RED16849.1 mannose-6-phosphate isomerase type 1 [Parasphingopyxis lamellibrachiae]